MQKLTLRCSFLDTIVQNSAPCAKYVYTLHLLSETSFWIYKLWPSHRHIQNLVDRKSGMSDKQTLKRVRARTDPCGTPFLRVINLLLFSPSTVHLSCSWAISPMFCILPCILPWQSTNTAPTFTICSKPMNEFSPTVCSVVSLPFLKPAYTTGSTLSNTGDIRISIILSKSLWRQHKRAIEP